MPGDLISCIMPTRNRRFFVGRAILYFLRQDHAEKELLIVDDGEDSVADLFERYSDTDAIRYIRVDKRITLGAKRNIAVQSARGEFIAHWDDDDWSSGDRLSFQLAQLKQTQSDVCGMGDVLHYWPARGLGWLRTPMCGRETVLASGTFLYRRSKWEASRFAEQDHHLDARFLDGVSADRCRAISGRRCRVSIIHSFNTAARSSRDRQCETVPVGEIQKLMGDDHGFYSALRVHHGVRSLTEAPPPVVPVQPRPRTVLQISGNCVESGIPLKQGSLTVAAPFLVYDGYGSIAEFMVLGLSRIGVPVNVHAFRLDMAGMSEEFRYIFSNSRRDPAAPALCFCWPLENMAPFRECADLFMNTMWESSLLPAGWAAVLNRARGLIVPSTFCVKCFRDSGVTVPIEVVAQGIDPDVYPYYEREDRPGVTSLIVGTFVTRKNIFEGIAAWKLAFANDPCARLLIKSRFRMRSYVPDDARIEFVDNEETTRGIAHWYRQADVLMALGNEGFGLPLVEAMATGLPVVALSSEGQGDICRAAKDCLLPVPPAQWVAFNEKQFGPAGVRGIPAVADVAARLRWVADHPREARDMGRCASQWVHRHRNIWDMGPAILDVIDHYSHSPRVFRQAVVRAAG